jgi:hypothetical protein
MGVTPGGGVSDDVLEMRNDMAMHELYQKLEHKRRQEASKRLNMILDLRRLDLGLRVEGQIANGVLEWTGDGNGIKFTLTFGEMSEEYWAEPDTITVFSGFMKSLCEDESSYVDMVFEGDDLLFLQHISTSGSSLQFNLGFRTRNTDKAFDGENRLSKLKPLPVRQSTLAKRGLRSAYPASVDSLIARVAALVEELRL